MIKEGKCQICEGPYDREFKWDSIPWAINPHSLHCCSAHCMAEALRASGAFQMRRRLKNIGSIPFSMFQEIFSFPEDGGYAEKQFERARSMPWAFVCGLDNSNYYKLCFAKI